MFRGITRRHGYRYFLYDKHHGRGGPEASQWADDITEEEEFQVFDEGDWLELSDQNGNLYGLRLRGVPSARFSCWEPPDSKSRSSPRPAEDPIGMDFLWPPLSGTQGLLIPRKGRCRRRCFGRWSMPNS